MIDNRHVKIIDGNPEGLVSLDELAGFNPEASMPDRYKVFRQGKILKVAAGLCIGINRLTSPGNYRDGIDIRVLEQPGLVTEARILGPYYSRGSVPFRYCQDLQPDDDIISFVTKTRDAEGKRTPYLNAKKFINWSHKMLVDMPCLDNPRNSYNIKYLYREWDKYSDWYKKFFDLLESKITPEEAALNLFQQWGDIAFEFPNLATIVIDQNRRNPKVHSLYTNKAVARAAVVVDDFID